MLLVTFGQLQAVGTSAIKVPKRNRAGISSPYFSMPAARRVFIIRPRMRLYRKLSSEYRNRGDSSQGEPHHDARSANAAWGWIVGAVLLVIVLAGAFVSFEPGESPCR